MEITQFHPLPATLDSARRSELDLYIFFPRSFGLSQHTWPTERFYEASKVAVRLRARGLRIMQLTDLDDPSNPGAQLRRGIEARAGGEPPTQDLVALAQMYGAEISDAFKDELADLQRDVAAARAPHDVSEVYDGLERLCRGTQQAFEAVASLRRLVLRHQPRLDPGLEASLSFAEEYAAAVVDERLSRLVLGIMRHPAFRDGAASAVKIRLLVARTLEQVASWRRSRGYVTPDSLRAEYYNYRLSILKKELQQALYLNSREAGRDPFYSNSAAMVAAALAATWATLAQVPLLQGQLWSARGALLLTGAVGAYVLKDRIKDLVKQRLMKKWRTWDETRRLLAEDFATLGLGAFTGTARERTEWLDPDELPSGVRDVRRMHRTVRGAGADLERVLHYRREVDLEVASDAPPEGYGIQEIIRLSLDDALRRLDDPVDTVCYYDPTTGRFEKKGLPRVYHLNIVGISRDEVSGERVAAKTRVIVNKDEIIRVETVGELDLTPG